MTTIRLDRSEVACWRPCRFAALFCTLLILFISKGSHLHAQSTIGTIGLTTGWATFGQAIPQGVATNGVQVGALATQTDVKSRWADGSIRFAIVTVNAPANANYAITSAAASTGTFTPFVPSATVTLTIGGVAYTATLPNTPSTDLWLSGPLVYEGRTVIAPISASTGLGHAFLRVNFDTRVYNDGKARVDVSVENVLDKLGATTTTYDVAIVVNGTTVFSKAAVQHFYLTRWRKTFAVGSGSFSAITPDMAPFNQSRAIPPYLSVVANQISSPTGANYDILREGALDPNMPAHGGRAELAPYPDWTARYLVHKNLTQRSFVLANGDLSGSWPVHVREAENSTNSGVGAERLISLDQRPNIWFDERAQGAGLDYIRGTPLPMREYGSTIPGPGQTALIPDNAHQPSLAYVPYLLTGDRYYAEEMAFWANYSMLRTSNGDGVRSSKGILQNNEVRGVGWGLRNLTEAAGYYPDASPVKAYLAQKVNFNLEWLDNYANAQNAATNPFRILWLYKRPDGDQFIGMWEQNYLAYAIDRAMKLGFTGGAAHRDAIAKFQLKLFTSDPSYPRAQGAPYVVGVGVPSAPFTFYTTMSQIWTATLGQERPFAGYYGPEARLNLMMGVEAGWAGAQAAYDYLWPFIGVTPTWGSLPDLGQRAGWALDFYSGSGSGPTPIPADIISPAPSSTLTSSSQTFTWTAGTSVTSYRLDVGTTQGSTNIYAGTAGTALSANVTGLPTNGSTIWVRLSSNIGGTWQFYDYTYTAVTSGGGSCSVTGLTAANTVWSDGNGARTTTAFNTCAGDLLVAFAGSDGPTAGGQTTSVSGGGLTWTMVRRVNGQLGVSEIWKATTATAQTGITVTATPTIGGFDASLTVVTFRNALGTGATGGANALTGAPSVSLTTTQAGSLVYAAGNDWDRAVARTLGASQTMAHQWVNTATGDTFWVQSTSAPVPAAGTVTQLNDTAPTNDRWNFAAVEIVPVSPIVLTINDVSLNEGNSGTTNAVFTVTLAPASTQTVTVNYATASGTATPPSDYAAASGTLTFPPGTTTQTISVSVQGDTTPEPNETFFVNLSGAVNAQISKAQGVGTIVNDDFAAIAANVTTVGPGEMVTATITNGPGDPSDWIGLYARSAPDAAVLDWKYLNGIRIAPATGLTNATVTFTMPLIAGAYDLRLLRSDYSRLGRSELITVRSIPALAVSSLSVTPGATVTVTVANAPGNASDWVGLYATGTPDSSVLDWKYLNDTRTAPATGLTNVTLTFTMPLTAGSYDLRMFRSDYSRLATSDVIRVQPIPTVSVTPMSAAPGTMVTAIVANAPGNASDWIGVYAMGSPDAAVLDWKYLNGTRSAPPTGLTSATVNFVMPGTGSYEMRMFRSDYSRLATSDMIRVQPVPTLSVNPRSAIAGATVSVTLTDGPGNASDWIGLYATGSPDASVLDWKYLNGTRSAPATGLKNATVTFIMPAAGSYDLRMFRSDYSRVATSDVIVVQP